MRDFKIRIQEKIEYLADGRAHTYFEVEKVLRWMNEYSRLDERRRIKKLF